MDCQWHWALPIGLHVSDDCYAAPQFRRYPGVWDQPCVNPNETSSSVGLLHGTKANDVDYLPTSSPAAENDSTPIAQTSASASPYASTPFSSNHSSSHTQGVASTPDPASIQPSTCSPHNLQYADTSSSNTGVLGGTSPSPPSRNQTDVSHPTADGTSTVLPRHRAKRRAPRYFCEMGCDAVGFATKRDLTRHYGTRKHDPDQSRPRYQCGRCGIRDHRRDNHLRHILKPCDKSYGLLYICAVCGDSKTNTEEHLNHVRKECEQEMRGRQ